MIGKGKQKDIFFDINVTPFVDVVLVLLVIFILISPFLYNQIPINIPKTTKQQKMTRDKVVILSITNAEEFYLDDKKILWQEIPQVLNEAISKLQNKIIYIRGSEDLRYGFLAKVMSFLKDNKFEQISLITETENK